jgi:hypothetical protein
MLSDQIKRLEDKLPSAHLLVERLHYTKLDR